MEKNTNLLLFVYDIVNNICTKKGNCEKNDHAWCKVNSIK